MNSFNGIGRLVKDPELKYTGNNLAVCNFTIAIERSFQKQGEEKQADFLNCVVFGATAEKFVSVYFKKGMRVGVSGEIRIDRVEKDGNTTYFTKITVQRAYFADGKREGNNQGDSYEPKKQQEEFYPVNDAEEDELPF